MACCVDVPILLNTIFNIQFYVKIKVHVCTRAVLLPVVNIPKETSEHMVHTECLVGINGVERSSLFSNNFGLSSWCSHAYEQINGNIN